MFSTKNLSLFVIAFVGFIDFLGIGFVYPMFSAMLYSENAVFLTGTGTSEALRGACLGLLLCLMPLTQFFFAPILGMLSDHYGRRKVLVPSLLCGVFGYLLAALAVGMQNLPLLLFSRICVGVAGATGSIIHASLADISTEEDKAQNFAWLNMAMGLGFTVGPFLGGSLSAIHFSFIGGYSLAFMAASLIALSNLILVIFYFKESYAPKKIQNWNMFQGIINIRKAFLIKDLRYVFPCVFFGCVGWSFYWEFIPVTWISLYGFDTVAIGNAYAYSAAFYALSCGFLIRHVIRRFPSSQALLFGTVGCAAAISLFLLYDHIYWLLFCIPLQQFAIALFWPTAATTVSNAVGEDKQGEALGALQSVDALAFGVSPLIAGPLLAWSVLAPIVVSVCMMLLGGGILSLGLRKKQAIRTIQ